MSSSWKSIFVAVTTLSLIILVAMGLTVSGIAFSPFF